jgi:hypothetical protein
MQDVAVGYSVDYIERDEAPPRVDPEDLGAFRSYPARDSC